MASVKVAVRVRPFNQRELDMGCQKIIEMEGKKTRIQNIKVAEQKQSGEAQREKYRDFTFDYSYCSFDSQDEEFASQEQVFMDLGRDVVDNAFQGYNACVFAYGQTGSGKTHTMMGSPTSQEAQGLIPRICKDMFNRMNEGKENGVTYRTEVSYLEIYNERVKDLLKKNQTHSLKVREHNKHGIYVEDLSKHLVMDYADIQDLMERGNASRTTASTNMNDVSSRSHAIFTMTFVQARFVGDMPSETKSKIHLVDLAGSERADASGATGQRLKEGGHINKSLVTLGSVISALADAAQSKKPNAGHIPYRNSVLTWLLKDSLGGNAKTIMIAAISPADVNYGETLSTLRYANRAKNIINRPTINEDANVKLIRDLRAEINKLKSMIGTTVELSDSVLEQIHEKEAKEKVLTEEWTEKWKETQSILMEQKDLALRKAGTGVVLDSQMPHLIGIDDDLLSTGITLYHLREGETQIGSEEDGQYDIMLRGLGLEPSHCSILLSNGVATLVPMDGAICLVNGLQIDKPTRLSQGCVIRLGTNMFRYNDPAEAEKLRREGSRLNLSRQNILSRSTTDLAWSSESLHFAFTSGEENAVLEEKRKQLEAEEARLQKESQELLSQKAQLEQQKNQYQLLQQEKEEAWKAEQVNKSTSIQMAQKELEEKRHKLEHEYAAHRRRLAEDWKRLEQQEQDTLSSLKSKEADLKKRKEYLEMEVEREVDQIENEAQKIESLREQLVDREKHFEQFQDNLAAKLKEKLSMPKEEVKRMLSMDDTQFANFVDHQAAAIEQWKKNTEDDLMQQKDILQQKLKDLAQESANCDDESQRAELQRELEALKVTEKTLKQKLDSLTAEYSTKKEEHALLQEALADPRVEARSKKQECLLIETDISNGMQRMVTSENKIAKIESDLVLIADQEKLICNQLAHIDKSKQKLLTIIEHSTEETTDDLVKKMEIEDAGNVTSEQGSPLSPSASNVTDNGSSSGELSASKFDSPKVTTPVNLQDVKLSVEEGTNELKRLVDRINDQKTVVLECLENDCDKEELNKHMTVLQDLRNKYLEIECILDRTARRRWLYDDEDSSTFDFDKGDEYGMGGPMDSDQDDSEAHSSVMDHDDQIQILIDQGVERRLREIFEQLKTGQKPNSLFKDNGLLSRRSMLNSMPNGLNNAYGSGSDDDGSSGSPRPIPRSISMNSTGWAAVTSGAEVIPGLLEINIPTFVLRGTGGNTHYEYEVCITTPSEKYSILRRYTKFRELNVQMKKKYGPKISNIPFPPKRFLGGRSESLAKERRILLENYIQNLVRVCVTIPLSPLHSFITKPNNVDVRQTLITFSTFFEKGFFECTKYGTS